MIGYGVIVTKSHLLLYHALYSPSNLTTRGIFNSNALAAFTIPLATVAQFTIPPKMFTRTAFTY